MPLFCCGAKGPAAAAGTGGAPQPRCTGEAPPASTEEYVPAGSAPARLVEKIRQSEIGGDEVLKTPFGSRRLTYSDYTASGRSLAFIEDYIRQEVMPLYANTHTEASVTGRQTGRYREDARQLVLRSVGGCPKNDAVIFCGSGATGAIKKLADILQLTVPVDLDRKHGLSRHIPPADVPVVFIGPYEHHSNELIWRESIARVVVIGLNSHGGIDIEHLRRELKLNKAAKLKIGSFSAASNVTGVISDTQAVARLLHQHGAISCWDFAAAGPHVSVRMNAGNEGHKDAVFISPHKFVGGPQTPGVLVVKRSLLLNSVPSTPGGGTVTWVDSRSAVYSRDSEHREEAGTPAIVEAIRCGLVFQLRDAVGAEYIEQLEHRHLKRALARWKANENIVILGPQPGDGAPERLAIVSFLVRHGDSYLHHNLVVRILSDLLGVQARGGCSCAGPYGIQLLGYSGHEDEVKEAVFAHEALRPGWTRVGFPYFFSQTVIDFLIDAVDFVATHGWKFQSEYRLDMETGQWSHHSADDSRTVHSLHGVSYAPGGEMVWQSEHTRAGEEVLEGYLAAAHRIADRIMAARSVSGGDEQLDAPLMSTMFMRSTPNVAKESAAPPGKSFKSAHDLPSSPSSGSMTKSKSKKSKRASPRRAVPASAV